MKKVLLFLTILFILPTTVNASVFINTYLDSEYFRPSNYFSEGAVYFTTGDGSHCCGFVNVTIKNEDAEKIYVNARDDGILPDNKANDGIFFGVFYIGKNDTNDAINYIHANTNETIEIVVLFSIISSTRKNIYTEFNKPSPVNLSVVFEENAVVLNWTESHDPLGIEHYLVYKHTEKFSYNDITKVSSFTSKTTNYIDRAIEDGKTYYYAVVPVNILYAIGNLSNIAEIKTPDITPPKPITDLDYVQYKGEIILNWSEPKDNVGISKYYIYRDKKPIESAEMILPYAETENITYRDTNTNDGEKFYYAVSAVDASDNTAKPSNNVFVTIDRTPPKRINNLRVYLRKNGEVFINWSEPEKGVRYKIYSSAYPITSVVGLKGIIIDKNEYSDFPERPVYYAVVSVDENGNEAEISNIVYAEPDDIPPSPIKDFSVLTYEDGTVVLSWNPSGSQDVEYYNIYRMEARKNYSLIGRTKNTTFSKKETTGIYSYAVSSVDRAGNEGKYVSINVNVVDNQINLEIFHPKEGLDVSQSQISVLGKTDTDADVLIENNNMVFDAVVGRNGNFIGYANLTDGENLLKITAVDPSGNMETLVLKIYNRYTHALTDISKKLGEYIEKNISFDEEMLSDIVSYDPSISKSNLFTGYIFMREATIIVFIVIFVIIVLISHKRLKREVIKVVERRLRYEYKEKKRLRCIAMKYISAIPSEIIKGVKGLRIKKTEKEITVLFADIREFMKLGSELGKMKTADMLDKFFNRMAEIVMNHGGVVSEYVGDRVYATFNLNKKCSNHTYNAVIASLEMHNATKKINRMFFGDKEKLRIGIGIKSGKIVAGTLGHPDALKYTAVGHVINLASRLSDIAKAGETIIDRYTYEKVKGWVNVMKGRTRIKGIGIIDIFKVVSLKE